MRDMKKFGGTVFMLVLAAILMTACGSTPELTAEPEATRTPTELVVLELPTPTETPDPCDGLAGTIEMQVLVGPSEIVGMEPVSVGNIPFIVEKSDSVYLVQGSGPLLFDDQVYEAEWGTYTVSFNAEVTIQGACQSTDGTATLEMTVVMEGEQMTEVRATGFSGDYPWSGTQTMEAVLPATEGATASGEGWAIVLHLGP